MRKIILTLVLCLFFSQDVSAGNKGIFEKGYMYPEKVVDTKDLLVWADDLGIGWTIPADYDVYFTLDDVNGEQVQVTLSEIYRLLRSIAPEISDKAYQRIKEIPEGSCPVCGSEERLTYWYIPDDEEREDFITLRDVDIYICADCGNVYAFKEPL